MRTPLGVVFRRIAILTPTAALLLLGQAPALPPDGASVSGGQATVQKLDPSTLEVRQTTDRAIINWKGFSIDVNELVKFVQPGSGSVALNRVTGNDPSSILGSLAANGRVFLVNPNGIVFGQSAKVDVAGLVASTFAIKDADFMAGKYEFSQDPNKALAAIVNKGEIKVSSGGFVFLVAPAVSNEGLLVANLGKVVLGAGDKFVLDFTGDGLIQYELSGEVLSKVVGPDGTPMSSAVSNSGTIQADGGHVLLSGKASNEVFSSVINQSGVIEARSLVNKGGVIRLEASDAAENNGAIGAVNNFGKVTRANGTVVAGGTLDVSALEDGAAAGLITLTGERVGVFGTLSARGADGGRGGNVLVSSTVRTVIAGDATIDVSGAGAGDAGNVVVWSDADTIFHGTIRALGGALGGNGGQVEVSGHENLAFNGSAAVDGPGGSGEILLDPNNGTVVAAGGANNAEVADQEVLFADGGAVDFTIDAAAINALTGPLVRLQALDNWTFDAVVNIPGLTAGEEFRVQAGDNINVNASITTAGAKIAMASGDPASGSALAGAVFNVNAAITSGGGAISLLNGGTGALTLGASVDAGAGAMNLGGAGVVTQTAGTITASTLNVRAGGAITLNQATNNVGTLAGNATTGNFSYRDADTLAINSVAGDVVGGVVQIASNGVGADAANIDIQITTGAFTVNDTAAANDVVATVGSVQLFVTGAADQLLTVNAGANVLGPGGVTLQSDNIDLAGTANSAAGRTSLVPTTAGTLLDLGGADGAGTLGITDAEMDRVTAGVLQIGDGASGNANVSVAISPGAAATLAIVTGGNVTQAAAATITETNLRISSVNAVTLNQANAITTLAGVVSGAAQTFSFTESSGLTVDAVDGVDGVSTNNSAITLTATTGGIIVNSTPAANDVNAGTSTVALNAQGANQVLSIAGGAVVQGTGGVTYTADNMAIAGSQTNAGASRAILQQTTAGQLLDLGGADAAGTLGLASGELDTVTAGILQVGSVATGNVTVTASIAPAGTNTLTILTNGNILENAGATITETNLRAGGGGFVTLNQDNNVTNLAGAALGAGQAFSFVEANGLTITTVDTANGVRTSNGAITITATTGGLTVANTAAAQDVDAGANTVALSAQGLNQVLDIAAGAAVQGTGGVTYTGDNISLGAASATNAGANDVAVNQNTNGTLIDLGGADAAGTLGLTDAELDTLTTGNIEVGNGNSGNVTVTAAIDTANTNVLSIITGGGVTQNAGQTITEANLRISSANAVALGQNNNVTNLAGRVSNAGQGFAFTDVNALVIDAVDGVNGVSTNGGRITLVSNGGGGGGNLTVNNTAAVFDVDAVAGIVDLNTAGINQLLTVTGAVRGQGGTNYSADNMTLTGATDATGAIALLQPNTAATNIDVGGADAAGLLGLTSAELNLVTANILRVGNVGNGTLTVTAAIAPAGTATLSLRAGGTITQNGAGNINETNLQATSGTQVNLPNAGNALTEVAGVVTTGAGQFTLASTGALTVGSVDAVNGITAVTGVVTVTALSPLTVNQNITTAGDIVLTATEGAAANCPPEPGPDSLTVSLGATVQSTAGDITLNAGDAVIVNGSVIAGTSAVTPVGDVFINAGQVGDNDGCGQFIQGPGGNVTGATVTTAVLGDIAMQGTIQGPGGAGSSVSFVTNEDIGVTLVTGFETVLLQGRSIIDTNGAGTNNVDAITLTVLAVNNTGAVDTNNDGVEDLAAGVNAINLDTTLVTLTRASVSGAGNIAIRDLAAGVGVTDPNAGLAVTRADTANGSIGISATGGNLVIATPTVVNVNNGVTAGGVGGDVVLASLVAGDVVLGDGQAGVPVDATVEALGDNVFITSAAAIRDGSSISDSNDVTTDVASAGFAPVAATTIGTATNRLETNVTTLAAQQNGAAAGGNGVFIHDLAGGLTLGTVGAVVGIRNIGGAGAAGGTSHITASSPIVVNADVIQDDAVLLEAGESQDFATRADDLTVDAGITVQSNNSFVTLRAGDDIHINGTVTAATTVTLASEFGDNDNDLAAAGGIDTGAASSITGADIVFSTLNNVSMLGAITTAGTFRVTASADTTGTITDAATATYAVTGLATFDAGTSTVTVGNGVGDNFGSLTLKGGAVTINEASGSNLSTVVAASLNLTSAGSVTDSSNINVTGNFTINAAANDVVLGDQAGDIVNFGSLTVTAANNVTITEDSGTQFEGASAIAGNLTLVSLGAITDGANATLNVVGTASFNANAGNDDITFGNDAGDVTNFANLTVFGKNVTISEDTGTNLAGTSTVLGNLTLTANGDLTDSANTTLNVTGTATFDVSANSITLGDNGTDVTNFGSLRVANATNATISEDSATVLTGTSTLTGALTINAAGTITDDPGVTLAIGGAATFNAPNFDITLGDQAGDTVNFNSLTVVGANVAITEDSTTDFAGVNTVTGALTLISTGNITDGNGTTINVTGLASLNANAGASDITLGDNAGDTTNFGTLTLTGANVTLSEDSATVLAGVSTVTGFLQLTSAGSITDANGTTLNVTGNAALSAVGNDITLGDNAADSTNFGTLTVTAANVTITEDSATVFSGVSNVTANLTLDSGGTITDAAATDLTVAGLASFDAGANDITLGDNAGDTTNFGTVEVAGRNVTFTEDSAVTFAGVNTATGTLTATGFGAITDAAGTTFAVGAAATFTAGDGAAVFFDITLGDDVADVTNFGSLTVAGLNVTVNEDSGTVFAGVNTATGNLVMNSAGAITDAAATTFAVTGQATFNAAGFDITLGDNGADTTNFGSLNVTGANVTVTEDSGTIFTGVNTATGNLTMTSNGAITDVAATTFAVGGRATFNAGANDVTLGDDGADLTNFGSLNFTGGTVTITEDSAMVLTGVNTAAALSLTAAGTITDDPGVTLNVAGQATFNAAGFDVVLGDQAGDTVNFGSLTITGANVSVSEDSALVFAGVNTATGNLTASANGTITDNAATTFAVGGQATFNAGANDITLGDDAGDTTNFGSLNVTGVNVTITEDSGTSLTGVNTVTGALVLTSGGAMTDVPGTTINVTGQATLNAGANDITLGDDPNDVTNFGSLTVTGVNVTISEDSATIFTGVNTATGNLSMTSNGSITDAANTTFAVTGQATFNAGANDITLGDNGGDVTNFGSLTVTGANVTVTEDSGTILTGASAVSGNLVLTANGSITDNAATTINVAGQATFNAGANDITLGDSAGDVTNFGSLNVTGVNVTITEDSATIFTGVNTATGNLVLNASGTITDAAATTFAVTGQATFNAAGFDITLGDDAGDVTNFGSLNVTGATVTVTEDSGTIFTGVNTATGNLTLTSNGTITDAAATTFAVGGRASFNAGANDITLGDDAADVTNFGSLTFTGVNVTITEDSGSNLTGVNTATGALVLTANGAITDDAVTTIAVTGQATFNAGGFDITLGDQAGDTTNFGSLNFTGGTVAITEDSAMILTGVNTAVGNGTLIANGSITDNAATTLNIGGLATLNAGANDITLGDNGADVTNFGSLNVTGANVTISEDSSTLFTGVNTATGNLVLNSAGAITDVATTTINVTLQATLNAGANDITLGDDPNDVTNFGSLNVTGGIVTISEDSATVFTGVNTAATLTMTSNGSITDNAATTFAVAGAATFNAGANDITLGDNGADVTNFGTLNVTGANVTLTEDSATIFTGTNTATGNLTMTSNGSITDNAATNFAVTGLATFNAGANDITLGDDVNDVTNFGSLNVTGVNVTVTEDSATVFTGVNTATGALTMTSNGSITDNAATTFAVTGTATFTAANGLGTFFDITLGDNGADVTNFGSLTFTGATVTITEDSGMLLTAASTATGNATLTANGAITDNAGTAIAVTGRATLNAGANAITLGDNDGADTTNFGSLALTGAAVTINEDSAMVFDGAAVNSLTVTAKGSITDTGAVSGQVVATILTATTLDNNGSAITLDTVTNDAANINLSARNAANSANAAGAITYVDANNFTVDQVRTTAAVSLTSVAGAIVSGAGATDVTGSSLVAVASTGIGVDVAGNPLTTIVTNLEAQTATGGIFITNTGPLTIGGISANVTGLTVTNAGGITVATASPMTISEDTTAPGDILLTAGEIADAPVFADDLTVNAVTVRSTGGNVTLRAGDDVILNAGSVVQAFGNVELTAGFGDLDGGGVVIQNGTVISQNGTVTTQATGDVFLGFVNGPGGVTIISQNGSIFDANGDALNILATGDVFLLALGGTVALPGDAIEVDVNNGDVFVEAAREFQGLSVNLVGTIQPNDTIEALVTPPGLVAHDFRVLGGGTIELYNHGFSDRDLRLANEPGYFTWLMTGVLAEKDVAPAAEPQQSEELAK
ncbi:MAG: filamentous hemagglutinin N-terminal domain-containing protein [Planctomycetes bacterium]|nr:filamentous hemagglutinin N-terminal domain-containing protein [Planctomycetota bacterium]